jgi:perosamine synthetase
MGSRFDARGKVCCWSFHTVKNLSCGEGGAISTDDPVLAAWAKRMRWLGITKSTHERSTGSYRWDYDIPEVGYKYHMADINAAIGLVQLEKLHTMQEMRRVIAKRYRFLLSNVDEVQVPAQVVQDGNAWHLFYLRAERRDELMQFLAQHGVATGVHYKPLYLHKGFAKGARCMVVDSVWPQLVSLPMYCGLTGWKQIRICNLIKEFYARPK